MGAVQVGKLFENAKPLKTQSSDSSILLNDYRVDGDHLMIENAQQSTLRQSIRLEASVRPSTCKDPHPQQGFQTPTPNFCQIRTHFSKQIGELIVFGYLKRVVGLRRQ